MQLVPYLKAAFQRYSEDGTPPFRALVLDDPKNKRLYLVDDQYMIGDRMMVAPLFAGEPSRKVVMPQGEWHNFWTGEKVAGGTEFNLPASTERIPIYVKSGSIVPWADVGQHAETPETRRITARVYGDGSLLFELKNEKAAMRLTWSGGKGSANMGEYDVYRWEHVG